MGEVSLLRIFEVLFMILRKYIDFGMRCLSIIIIVAIFFLSSQSRLPTPVKLF